MVKVRHFSVWLAAAATILSAPGMADEGEPLQLEPSSAWVIDYADDSCALRRSFGQEGQVVWFEMRQFAPGASFQVSVASSDLEPTTELPLTRFEPDMAVVEQRSSLFATFGDGVLGVVFTDSLRPSLEKGSVLTDRLPPDFDKELIPADEPDLTREWEPADRVAREKAITGLLVTQAFTQDFVLQTGEMHAPMNAMRACTDELLSHWGIDVAAHKRLLRRAEPKDQQRWARNLQRRFPAKMIRQSNSGHVRVRLLVSRDGTPASCHIQAPSQHEEFEDAACQQLMKDARFEPALDSTGQPILSYWVTSITYLAN